MNTGLNTISQLLTPDDIAGLFKVSKTTVYRMVEKRQLPFHKVGNSLRFNNEDVLEYLTSNRIEPVKM